MASILEQKLPKSTSLGSREKEWISVVFHSDILLPKLSLLIVFHLPHLLSVLGHRLILFKICKRVITWKFAGMWHCSESLSLKRPEPRWGLYEQRRTKATCSQVGSHTVTSPPLLLHLCCQTDVSVGKVSRMWGPCKGGVGEKGQVLDECNWQSCMTLRMFSTPEQRGHQRSRPLLPALKDHVVGDRKNSLHFLLGRLRKVRDFAVGGRLRAGEGGILPNQAQGEKPD